MSVLFRGTLPWLINDYQKEIAVAPSGTVNVPDLFPMKIQDICKIFWLAKHATATFNFTYTGDAIGGNGSASGTSVADFSYAPPAVRTAGISPSWLKVLGVNVNPDSVDLGPQYEPNDNPPPAYLPNGQNMIIQGLQLQLPSPGQPGQDIANAGCNLFSPASYYGGYTSFDKASGLSYVRAGMVVEDQDNTIEYDEFGGVFFLPPLTNIWIQSAAAFSGNAPQSPTLDIQINGNTVGSAPLYSNGNSFGPPATIAGTFILNFDDFFSP